MKVWRQNTHLKNQVLDWSWRGSEIWQKYNQSSGEDRQGKTALQTYTEHTDFSRVLVTADLHMVQDIQYPTAPGFLK